MVHYMNCIAHYRNHVAQEENCVARDTIHVSQEAGNLLLRCTEPVYLAKQCRLYSQGDNSVKKC